MASNLTAPEVSEGLAVLRGTVPCDTSLRERLENLAARLDDEYLLLNEAGGQDPYSLAYFSRARATSALVLALAIDDVQLHEAIYEAISTLDDPAELVSAVERAFG